MSSPSNPNTANIYTTFGSSPSGSLNTAIRASRAPTTSDTKGPGGNFVIGQRWVYVGDSSYTLIALTPVNGVVTATWAVEGGGTSQLSQLTGDTGTATPAAGSIQIVGGAGVVTSASGSVVTVELEGGGVAIDSVTLQAGTTPCVPTAAGAITLSAAVVAAGVTPIVTNGTAPNTATIQVQTSQAIAATDATKVGLCNFDSSQFAVDANGFVSLAGGGQAIDSLVPTTGTNPVVPTAGGAVTFAGNYVVAGTTPVSTNGTGANSISVDVQVSQAIAAPDGTKVGLCNFDSSQFAVDVTGFVTLAGGGQAIDSFTPDAGTSPVVPSATGLVAMSGTANQITTTGGLNSLTFSVPSTFIAPGSIAATTTLSGTAVTASAGNITATNGNFVRGSAGNKDVYSSVASTTTAGDNSAGTVTLVGGTATISTTAVTASSLIRIYRQGIGATGAAALGILTIGTITAATSFVINSVQAADATALQASDVSVVFWEIVN